MKPVTVPLLGYAPDLDPATPGAFSYCLGVQPTLRGWQLQRARSSIGATSGSTFSAGSYILDGSVDVADDSTTPTHIAMYDAGSLKYKLYAIISSVLTDKSKSGSYDATTTNFSFTQYGNYTLATNLIDPVQYRDSTTTNAFADTGATGIPKAQIAVTYGPPSAPHVMLFNYNDGANHYTDGWWNSHYGGPLSDWTPNIATGAANGRLLGAGTIYCAVAFRDDIIAFGKDQMWRGTFVGGDIVVAWENLGHNIRCPGINCATVLNDVLYWVGQYGLWMYDGSYPRLASEYQVQNELRDTIINVSSADRNYLMVKRAGKRLWIAIVSNGAASTRSVTKWYSVYPERKAVGLIDPTGVQLIMIGGRLAGLASSDVTVKAEGSAPYAAALTDLYGFGLHYFGDNSNDTLLVGVRPRFVTAPVTYKCTDYFGPSMSETLGSTNTAVTVSATPWRADFTQSARWHAPRLYFSSDGTVDPEVIDCELVAQPAGSS